MYVLIGPVPAPLYICVFGHRDARLLAGIVVRHLIILRELVHVSVRAEVLEKHLGVQCCQQRAALKERQCSDIRQDVRRSFDSTSRFLLYISQHYIVPGVRPYKGTRVVQLKAILLQPPGKLPMLDCKVRDC